VRCEAKPPAITLKAAKAGSRIALDLGLEVPWHYLGSWSLRIERPRSIRLRSGPTTVAYSFGWAARASRQRGGMAPMMTVLRYLLWIGFAICFVALVIFIG